MEQGQNLTTEVTMDDINNGIADENGVIYSKDGKRLLSFGNNKSETYTIKGGTIVICDNAFKRSTNLQKIKIPESIKKIGYSAFQECFELQKINLPNSITMIGDWCFSCCEKIQIETIPTSVLTIGDGVFFSCESLKNITIPTSVNNIGNSAFAKCKSLKKISITGAIKFIGDCAFTDCKSLQQMVITDSVVSIGRNPFEGCKKIELISQSYRFVVKNGLLLDQENIVISCIDHKSSRIIIPDTVTVIANNAFAKCKTMKQITIPNSVTRIEDCAFFHCGNLLTISIPNSVTYLGADVFAGCSKLKEVEIPNSVTDIRTCAFKECKSLKKVFIPDSVTTIGNGAFAYCSKITKITIPKSVTKIEKNAFLCCRSLQQIDIQGCITSIDEYTFWGCEALPEIILPKSITTIENGTFGFCKSLKRLSIPDSVETIGNDVIENCVSLEHNPIPIKFHKKRIKKIIINNFRAFQTEEIEFDKFNCIIGKNDSGKSTLFAALEWFFNANKVLSENDFAASGFDISKDKQDMYNDLTISVEVYFSGINIPNSSTEYNFIYAKDFLDEENCLCIRKYMKHPMSTILGNRMGYSIKSFPLIRNGETIFTERYKKSSEELEKIYSKYFLDDLPSKLYELEDAESDAEIVSEIEYLHIQKNNIKRQICDNLHNLFISSNEMPRWEDFHNEQSKPFYLDWFNSYQFQIYAANTPISNYLNGLLTPDNAQNVYISIEKAKTKTAGKLFKILQNNNVIENISFKTNESINLFTNNSVNFKILDLPIWIPLKNRGDGLQLMIKQAVIEMLAVEQLGSSNVVFAFEEPETHLHPDAQIKMYKIIKKLSENPKYQVFMTTHSPYIVKELAKDRINPIVIERDEKNNKSSKRDLKERVLPYVSMNEINYIAFDLASEEFHQELYGQIEIDWFGESNGSKIDQIIEKLRYYKCANSDKSFNELVKTLIDKYNNDNNSNIDLLTNEFFSPDKGKEPSRCLCHCVRNSIDHPCEGNNKWKEYGLIDLSINILLQIYSCFKDIKKTFLDRISDLTESELDGKFPNKIKYYIDEKGNKEEEHSSVYWVKYNYFDKHNIFTAKKVKNTNVMQEENLHLQEVFNAVNLLKKSTKQH